MRFFSVYPTQQAALSEGSRVRAFGEVRGGFFGAEMVHPRFQKVAEGEPLATELTPIYPSTAGVANSALQKLIGKALETAELADTLPDDLRQQLKLPGFARSLHFLHTPPPGTDLDTLHARNHPAWRRLKFDEVLAQQLSLRRSYLAGREKGAPVLVARDDLGALLLDRLSFGLTGAQLRAKMCIRDSMCWAYSIRTVSRTPVQAPGALRRRLAKTFISFAAWMSPLASATAMPRS